MPVKLYLNKNVFEMALERIERIYNEFPNVVVCLSGGKDSTVILGLSKIVAKKMGRLPVNAMFIDQEAEWQATVDVMRKIRNDPEVSLNWYQMPIKIFNASSHISDWLYCWKEGDQWMREKESGSITENVYGTDRFKDLFPAILNHEFSGVKACQLGGMRAEETPKRAVGLTLSGTYKDITYGKIASKKDEHYIFHPIYDWSYTDVWKFIHDYKLGYNRVYDLMYSIGIGVRDMRVSNLHHETSLKALTLAQKFERDTWEKLLARLSGVNSIKQMSKDALTAPSMYPPMFSGWVEYRDYLLENLVQLPKAKEVFRKAFDRLDKRYAGMSDIVGLYKVEITSMLANDYYLTKLENWESRPQVFEYRKFGNKGSGYHNTKHWKGKKVKVK